jgi:hypothetical protein
VAQRFSIGDKNLSLGMKRFEVAGVTYPLSVLLGVLKEREKTMKMEAALRRRKE